MTSEILVMNKNAIAMAADSALTVDNKKSYVGVNKLFMLSNDPPMGIMIYGKAHFMEMPMETLIKEYRRKCRDEGYETVNQFMKNFLSLIEKYARSKIDINSIYEDQKIFFKKLVKDQLKGLDNKEKKDLLKDFAAKTYKKKVSMFDINEFNSYSNYFDEIINNEFGGISGKEYKEIKEYLQIFFIFILTSEYTGIVIAGFNVNDIYPSYISYDIFTVFNGRLKYLKEVEEINSNFPCIAPFAQRDVVDTFLTGMNENIEKKLGFFMRETINSYPDILIKAMKENKLLSEREVRIIEKNKEKLVDSNDRIIEKFEEIVEKSRKEFYSPILSSVNAFPKHELVNICESLIYITSLKKKISNELESVGGNINVAIISKGDGFIWYKKKHYIKPDLNQHIFGKNNFLYKY